MKPILFFLSVLHFSFSAMALTKTNYNLTPDANHSEIRLSLEYVDQKFSATGYEATAKGTQMMTSFTYGLTENHSVGVGVVYGDAKLESTISGTTKSGKQNGLGDVLFVYQGNFELKKSTLFFGAALTFPSGKEKVNVDNGDQSVSSGQKSLALGLGIVQPLESLNFGGALTLIKKTDGDSEITMSGTTATANKENGGGFLLRAFLEFPELSSLSASVFRQRTYSTKYTGAFTGGSDGTIYDGLDVESRIKATDGFELVPKLSYQTLVNKDVGSRHYDNSDYWTLGVTARFLF